MTANCQYGSMQPGASVETVGHTVELACKVAHCERYGAAGATYWVGRRAV